MDFNGGIANITGAKITSNKGTFKAADGTLNMTATGAEGQSHEGSTIKAKNVYMKAEKGNIGLKDMTAEATDVMNTRSNTISFENAKVKGDKTTVSTVQNMNLRLSDDIVGTSELTLHSDNDIISDNGAVVLNSANKITIDAGHDIVNATDLQLNAKEGNLTAVNEIHSTAGKIGFSGTGNLNAGNIKLNKTEITAANDLNANTKLGDIALVNSKVKANKTNLTSAKKVTTEGLTSIDGTENVNITAQSDIQLGQSTQVTGGVVKVLSEANILNAAAITGTSIEMLAKDNIELNEGTQIKATAGSAILKADKDHYKDGATPSGGIVKNNTTHNLADMISAEGDGAIWATYSNETQALKDDPSYYVYDQENSNYVPSGNRIVFYGKGINEPIPDPPVPPEPKPIIDDIDDGNVINSTKDKAEEKTIWKRFINQVEETKTEVNTSVNNFVDMGGIDMP